MNYSSLFNMLMNSGSPQAESLQANGGNFLTNHPDISAAGIALAEREINDEGLLSTGVDWFTASDILEGKATGLRGVFDKAWQANEVKNSVEVAIKKMGGGSLMQTIFGWAAGAIAYHEMGELEESINKKKTAPAPAAPGT